LVIKACKECQLIKWIGGMKYNVEDFKSIPICDLSYRVAFDIVGPLPKRNESNKYILMAINHYSKWCEIKVICDHKVITIARFIELDIIYRYGVLKFVLTNNGGDGL
jgi:hypothetical protein